MLPRITPPFFETGPKNYMYGQDVIEMARIADIAAEKYNVNLIYTTPYVNIAQVASVVKRSLVFAPHMDDICIGRGVGAILPEAVCAAGAKGVCLNHCEKPLPLAVLCSLIKRSNSLGIYSMACASSMDEIRAVTTLVPDIIIAEPTELIGTKGKTNMSYVQTSLEAVKSINLDVSVLIGGGISSAEDVYNVIMAGAEATGCASGIFQAANPEKMIDEMLCALREAWDERNAIT